MKRIKLVAITLMAMAVGVSAWAQHETSAQGGQIKQLEEQVAREPNNVSLLRQLGAACFYQARQGDAQALDKAIVAFERAAALAPSDTTLMRWLGLAYFLKTALVARTQADAKDPVATLERTLASFDRALERFPDDSLLLSAHGSALVILSGYKRSQELLNKGLEEMNRAVKSNPKAIHARLFRGFTHLNIPQMFRDDKSIVEDLDTILSALPVGYYEQAQGVIRVMLGDTYLESKQPARAKAEYEAATKLPSLAAEEARTRLAKLEQGQPDIQAIRNYRRNAVNCAICHTE